MQFGDTPSKGITIRIVVTALYTVITTLTSPVLPPPTTSVGDSVTLQLSALSTVMAKAALAYATEFYMKQYNSSTKSRSIPIHTAARGIIL